MAAGQQKKRLNATSITRFNVHEQHRGKKKKRLESSDNTWCMKSNISLEWDDNQKRVVAMKEQVAMSWIDVSPFVHSLPQSHSGLADVFSVPKEIFELENLTEVLSYEVWENHLSESERSFLIQFLPKDSDSDKVVLSLLTEENLNFGNPFNRWSSSLCSGNLHPDAVLHHACQRKAKQKLYYPGLKKYHHGIVKKLQKWKKRWLSCKNPEKELFGNLLRKGVMHPNQGDPQMALDRAKSVSVSTKDQPKKISISYGDAAKFMSYIKISRRQHQLVKNIKHSDDGIQSKSLNRVLGDIKGFNLQPYEAFEEEERKRLHEHWLQLACKDLPAYFEYHREQRGLRELWRQSLVQELAEKEEISTDEVEEENMEANLILEQVENEESHENLEGLPLELSENAETQHQQDSCGTGRPQSMQSLSSPCEPNAEISDQTGEEDMLKLPVDSVFSSEATSSKCPPTHESFTGHANSSKDSIRITASFSTTNCLLERIPSLNSHQEFSPTVINQENKQGDLSPADGSVIVPHSLEESIHKLNIIESRPSSSARNIWAEVGTQHSYVEPVSQCHMNTSTSDLSLRQPCPVEEHSAHLVNMKTDMLDLEAAGSVPSALNLVNDTSFFSSYGNQDRDILLPPFPKHQELLPSYAQQHVNSMKKPDLSFPLRNNGFTQSSGFFPNFQEQGDLLQQRHSREKELYMHQMANRSVYSNSPYLSQGNFSSAETQDWVSLSSPLNGGILNHNMFSRELRDNTMFGVEPPRGTINHSLGNGGSTDGSLFSVLPEYKKFPSTFPCNISSPGPLPPSGELVGVSRGDIYSFSANQLSNSTRNHEIPAAFKVDEMSWINLPHQNTNVHDSTSQPYMRPWNR